MILNEKQNEKMKNNMLELIEEIRELIKNKEIRLDIPLNSYFNEYGGLVLEIYKLGSIHYETNKTQGAIYTKYDIDNCIYGKLKKDNFFNTDIVLDILRNKEIILKTIKENIIEQNKVLNELLGG